MKYSRDDVVRILRLNDLQLSNWESQGLLARADTYSFFDLLQVKRVRDLYFRGWHRERIVASIYSHANKPNLLARKDYAAGNTDLFQRETNLQQSTILPITFGFSTAQCTQIVSVAGDFSQLLIKATVDIKELLQLTPR